MGQPAGSDHMTAGRIFLPRAAQASLALVPSHKELKRDLWASIIRPCLASGVTDFLSWLMLAEYSLRGRHCTKPFTPSL